MGVPSVIHSNSVNSQVKQNAALSCGPSWAKMTSLLQLPRVPVTEGGTPGIKHGLPEDSKFVDVSLMKPKFKEDEDVQLPCRNPAVCVDIMGYMQGYTRI